MLEDTLIVDSVVHGYNLSQENVLDGGAYSMASSGMLYGLHQNFSPRGEQHWILDQYNFFHGANPELLAHALFGESQTDLCIYHEVPMFGMFKDGGSPLWVGKAMQQRYPGRVLLYGAVSPFEPDPVGKIDWLVEEYGVVGIKLYPMDIVEGRVRGYRADDHQLIFPILERIRQRGLKSVAIHKAVPIGPVPMEPFKVNDIDEAATSFPDLNFEIVHGGFAFLEETAFQLARFPNVSINLEGTSAYLSNMPRKFAEILGTFLAWGGPQRIIWATGCIALHPRPLIEAFWKLEMPEDLVRDYGFPELTPEIKKAILGGNIARILGLDLEQMHREHANDIFATNTKKKLAEPWSTARGTLV